VDADNAAPAVAAQFASPEEFFRTHYRDLIKSTMIFGADVEQAREAVARTILDVVKAWDRLDKPLQWASRAAIHHYLKEKERDLHARRKRLAEKGAGTPEGDNDPQLTIWEDEQWVSQMLALLTPKQAQVMSLVMEGLTPSEISQQLGRTPGAVRQSLLEARKRLRLAIQQERASDQGLGSAESSSRKEG
jgi:RNA polymerase sigma factor (sigma-70 family)